MFMSLVLSIEKVVLSVLKNIAILLPTLKERRC